MKLDWRGDAVRREVERRMAQAMGRFGLEVEREAKLELRKGHGVETGTLRRSIHTAAAGYDWTGDDVEPSAGSPERGGQAAEGTLEGGQITVQVGSGIRYALAVHQGHGRFGGYHFLTNGLEKAKGKLRGILEMFRV